MRPEGENRLGSYIGPIRNASRNPLHVILRRPSVQEDGEVAVPEGGGVLPGLDRRLRLRQREPRGLWVGGQ